MGKTARKLLVVLLTFAICLGLLPMMSLAEEGTDTDKTIMLGTTGISDPVKSYEDGKSGNKCYYAPSDYIWYGKNKSAPIKWRVLDADNGSGGMFLLSEYLMTAGREVYFDQDGIREGAKPNTWQGSDAQAWCKDFAGEKGAATNVDDAFSEKELGAVLATTKTDERKTLLYLDFDNRPILWGESNLSGDKVFFLSTEELSQYVGSYRDAPGLKATAPGGDKVVVWWLRSPHAKYGDQGSIITEYGHTYDNYGVYYASGARPAFNLNLDSVLFTSAAEGGKSYADGFRKVDSYAGNTDGSGEWKVTLKDSSRNFKVTESSVSTNIGGTITLNYTGAATGTNEHISAMIVSASDEVLYYGKLKATADSADAFGEVKDIRLPSALSEGSYSLKVFSEQCNGDKQTDYASTFADVALTVGTTGDTALPAISEGSVAGTCDTEAWDNPFIDVQQNDWFYESVALCCAKELMKGTGSTTFSPDAGTTRGMIVTVLCRLEGSPEAESVNPFKDLENNSWYTDAVIWAVSNEIVKGYGDDRFGPEDKITREQMAAILFRYAQYKGYDVSAGEDADILSYKDASGVSEWAVPSMQWACGTGIIHGSDGNLMPQDNATRAQAAAMFIRFLNTIAQRP